MNNEHLFPVFMWKVFIFLGSGIIWSYDNCLNAAVFDKLQYMMILVSLPLHQHLLLSVLILVILVVLK